jgi:hypothetical protein
MCHNTHKYQNAAIERTQRANIQRLQDQTQNIQRVTAQAQLAPVLPSDKGPQPQRWSYPGIFPGTPPQLPAWQASWYQQPSPAHWPATPQPAVKNHSFGDAVLNGFIGALIGAAGIAFFLFISPFC